MRRREEEELEKTEAILNRAQRGADRMVMRSGSLF